MADLERGLKINELTEATNPSSADFLAIDDGTNTYKVSIATINRTGSETAQEYAEAAAASAQQAESYYNQTYTAVQSINDTVTSATAQLQGYVNEAADCAASAEVSRRKIESLITSDYAKTAKSYAVGDTGYREGEQTDNAKYYALNAGISEENALNSANTAVSAANDAVTASEEAVSLLEETRVYLTQVTFTVDFVTGNIMYNPTEAYDFTINTETGNLEWEVIVA